MAQQHRRSPSHARWGTYGILFAIILFSIFPLYWSIVVSSRDQSAIGRYPPPLVPGGSLWDNLSVAFEQGNFGLALTNSVIVAGTITVAVVYTSTLAGFAFAKLTFSGRNGLFAAVVGTML